MSRCHAASLQHRIEINKRQLKSEPLKIVSPRMSHTLCIFIRQVLASQFIVEGHFCSSLLLPPKGKRAAPPSSFPSSGVPLYIINSKHTRTQLVL